MQFSMQIWTREAQAACLAHKGIQLKHVLVQPRIAARQYGEKNKFYYFATSL